MALFQTPARTPEEVKAGAPLAVPPAEIAQMDEATWFARAYRGDAVPQLTLRAVMMGSLLGFLLAFTNLYVGLKTGWGLGVAITACILSFAIWNALLKLRVARTPMSILENNCMQSTASAAGYSTGNAMVSAVPALLLLSVTADRPEGQQLPWPVLAAWTFFVAALGTVLAIPMKRNLINRDRLKFPSGLAAAVTLQSLYSRGADAARQARALLYGALGAGIMPLLVDLKLRRGPGGREPLLPGESPIFDFLPAPGHDPKTGAAFAPSDLTIALENRFVLVAAGAITGLRVSFWMVAGGLILALAIAPEAVAAGAAKGPGRAWRDIGVWIGAPMMVSSGLLAFALQGKTIARAFHGFWRRPGGGDGADAARAAIEVPGSWFGAGVVVAGAGVTAVGHAFFGIPWPLGLAAVALSFFLALVACRATGESDITPVGAMGKITQLAYGVLIPQNATANLMTASITSSAAGSAADLLTDLKSGYLLGANPRRQFVAQFLGIFAGTVATVLGYYLLVPDARVLTGAGAAPPAFPAPAAQAWLAVARIFQEGFVTLHPMARRGMAIGIAVGAALVLLERATLRFAPRAARFLPSPTGLGLGFILPFSNPLSFLVGAVIAELARRRARERADRYTVPIASGAIAGESIVGVAVAATNNFLLR